MKLRCKLIVVVGTYSRNTFLIVFSGVPDVIVVTDVIHVIVVNAIHSIIDINCKYPQLLQIDKSIFLMHISFESCAQTNDSWS